MTERNYCVYEHVFPNGKKYIGITCDPDKRWRNGKGYETQGKIANAIKSFGWDHVSHNIIIDNITKDQAEKIEMYLIDELNTIENGYNTSIGGENINSSYLNEHILYMIRESDFLDKQYGTTPSKDDIVSLFRKGWNDSRLANAFNSIDEYVEAEFSDYKKLHSTIFYDGRLERCEGYWYYIRLIWEKVVKQVPVCKEDIKPYTRYRSEFYSSKLDKGSAA